MAAAHDRFSCGGCISSPRRRTYPHSPSPPEPGRHAVGVGSAQHLCHVLEELRADAVDWTMRLPDDADARLASLLLKLDIVAVHYAAFERDPMALHVIHRTMTDYLPSTVCAYLDVPTAQRGEDGAHHDVTAHAMLLDQLTILDQQIEQFVDMVRPGGHDRLARHHRFLRDKFG